MQKPLVSVIMGVYNTQSYIDAAVRSVLSQSYPNLELIIIDDGPRTGVKKYVTCTLKRTRG